MPSPAELIAYYQQALSPISNHAALQSSLAERDAAIRQQQAQRAQALQDQIAYANHVGNIQRQAAAEHARQVSNSALMEAGLRAQSEIAQTTISNKAATDRARALAGIQTQAQIETEKRKSGTLSGEAQNLFKQQEAARGRLEKIRTDLSNALTPPAKDASAFAVKAAKDAGVDDKGILAAIAANPRELDSIKNESQRLAAQGAYDEWSKNFIEKARNSNLGVALGRQFQDESVNYQALSNQFAQVAGYLPQEMMQQSAPAQAPTAAAPAAVDWSKVLGAVQDQAKQVPPSGEMTLGQRISTTPFLAPDANNPNPFNVPLVAGAENMIGQAGARAAVNTLGAVGVPAAFAQPIANANQGLIGQIGSRIAGAGMTIAGYPAFAGLQSMHDAQGALSGLLPAWLSRPPPQAPDTLLAGQVPRAAIQAQVLANAARLRDQQAAAAALAGTLPPPDQSL